METELAPDRQETVARHPRLPPELLHHVIESVLSANARALLPAAHLSTRTLLALTRVSRLTYAIASKLLRQRCVYIDSSQRLGDVLRCMDRFVPRLPPTLSLRHVTSLYLAPFPASSLQDKAAAVWVRELLCEVSETLRRLVVDMPFETLDPLEDHLGVRRTLREGFEQLAGLEEFACLGQYPALSVPEAHTDVWRLWPDLRRLALFNVPADSHWLWWDVATLPRLAHVVLARPRRLEAANIKDEYFHKLPRGDDRLRRAIRVVLVDTEGAMGPVSCQGWEAIDPGMRMTVGRVYVPTSFYGDETPDELVTAWVRRGALEGTIWDWEGERVGKWPDMVPDA